MRRAVGSVDHPTLAEVAADPVGVNAGLGTYTNFANLLDLCGVVGPAREADGSFFGADGGDDEGNLRPRRAPGRWSDSRAVPA